MWSNVICLLSRRSYTDTCKPRESFLQMVLRKTRRYKTRIRTQRKQCIKITSWTYDFCFIKLVCRLFLQVSFMGNEISIRDCFKWLQLFFTIHKEKKKKPVSVHTFLKWTIFRKKKKKKEQYFSWLSLRSYLSNCAHSSPGCESLFLSSSRALSMNLVLAC